jgi:hypothetical protein
MDPYYREHKADEMGDLDMEIKIARLVDQDFLLHSKLWR